MSRILEVKVPDIGDYKDVPVIEVLVKPGDTVDKEASLVTLESDKATMEVPSPAAGVVRELKVKVGDKVSQGALVLILDAADGAGAAPKKAEAPTAAPPAQPQVAAAPVVGAPAPATPHPQSLSQAEREASSASGGAASGSAPHPQSVSRGEREASSASADADIRTAHASPAVRRLAREFGVDLARVRGTGPKKRVLKEDVQNFVKGELARPRGESGIGIGLPPLPAVDFAKYGPIETRPLSRIRKLSGANLHRNWVSIPHVTQHDEADITELEAFRRSQAEEAKKSGIKFTMLGFLMKATVVALRQHPEFNASLSVDGESLVLKQYFHIGIAVDTPNGLVVPVIRDVDKKGLLELAKELGAVSERMRVGKIAPADLQGGCFSISSLGGIGGTLFTPIINAPEVAILGVGKAVMKQVWDGSAFAARLMLPLSLSYDHRVIDGAQGARFISYLASVLSDIRRLVL
jgi:pyruvate dehydrogenase E2 component (dihydrolipoyllysine-residue acetyltransferase)